MAHESKIIKPGLKVDGLSVQPGSVILTKSKPPSHWQRFSDYSGGDNKPVHEKMVDVATPDDDAQIKQARERFQEVTGKPPGRRKLETLLSEIELAEAEQESEGE